MNAHTPGPWRAEGRKVMHGTQQIAHANLSYDTTLIAAAPDLLAALSRVVEVMDGSAMPCIVAARAALAKAGV